MDLFGILQSLPDFKSVEIIKSFIKGYSIINDRGYSKILVSISGGYDSDIVLDIIYRLDVNKKVDYVWFDTGLEYQATRDHLDYLESKYNIKIRREKAVKPIPQCLKEYGQPFLSKFISEMIGRLQKHDFDFKIRTYEEDLEIFRNCHTAISWWHNRQADALVKNGFPSRFNIEYYKYLKEFLVLNPPHFKISNKCCEYAKKQVSKRLISSENYELVVTGIRKAEGGIRSAVYKNCYSSREEDYDSFRPIFWYTNEDKEIYRKAFQIRRSDAYERWGFERTGCCACPYGRNLLGELSSLKVYEPNLYTAAMYLFGDSYEYTKQFKKFRVDMKNKKLGKKPLVKI